MDWPLFIGLMLAPLVVIVVGGVLMLRFGIPPPRLPAWFAVAGMIVAGMLLIGSLARSTWLNAITSVILLVTFGMLVIVARRERTL